MTSLELYITVITLKRYIAAQTKSIPDYIAVWVSHLGIANKRPIALNLYSGQINVSHFCFLWCIVLTYTNLRA